MIGGMVGIAGHLTICDDVVVPGTIVLSDRKPGMYGGQRSIRHDFRGCGAFQAAAKTRARGAPARPGKGGGDPDGEGGRRGRWRQSCLGHRGGDAGLPHRYPFLLVDRVLECVPGKRIVALKNVTVNEAFFPGHFPGIGR